MATLYDAEALERLRSRYAVQPQQMRRFYTALFKKMLPLTEALELISAEARKVFSHTITADVLTLAERHDSAIDGATKLVFRAADGALIESVLLRPKTGRITLCISSQVGCACGCSFCATGRMGFVRNLAAVEILDQVTQAGRLTRAEGRTIRNVVFMGMGEPLLNLENLFIALDFMCAVPFFNYSPSRLMVSTVGIPAAMIQFVERFPQVQFALSLHSARQEVREQLVPQARSCSLSVLREVLLVVAASGKVMIEYLMLQGVNDGEADLQALIEYLSGLPVHINLIPFNEYPGCNLVGTNRLERERFAQALKKAGFNTTLRYSLGTDIAAACGQLVQKRSVPIKNQDR